MHLVEVICAEDLTTAGETAVVPPDPPLWPHCDAFSIEATAKQLAAMPDLHRRLPAGTAVYLPYLAGDDLQVTARRAGKLRAQGLRPVPHLAARGLPNRSALADALRAFEDAGIDSVLLIAGDRDQPRGPFRSTLDVLATGLLESHGQRRVGFAGHPEGHPLVEAAQLEAALREKSAWGASQRIELWLVTQFVFDAAPVFGWEARLRAQGLTLPVRVGVAGPTSMARLLSFAIQCGVGASARMLARRPGTARLIGSWQPETVVEPIRAHSIEVRASLIQGIHLFPFGGLDAALAWLDRSGYQPAERFPTAEGPKTGGPTPRPDGNTEHADR